MFCAGYYSSTLAAEATMLMKGTFRTIRRCFFIGCKNWAWLCFDTSQPVYFMFQWPWARLVFFVVYLDKHVYHKYFALLANEVHNEVGNGFSPFPSMFSKAFLLRFVKGHDRVVKS